VDEETKLDCDKSTRYSIEKRAMSRHASKMTHSDSYKTDKSEFKSRINGIDSSNELCRIEKMLPVDEESVASIISQSDRDKESRRIIAN
jgi:hypothetical protein